MKGFFKPTKRTNNCIHIGSFRIVYILNTIYGSTEANATVLRTGSDGKLATSDYSGSLSLGPFPTNYLFADLPPSRSITELNTPSLVRASGFGDDQILTAGDERGKSRPCIGLRDE